MRFFSLVAAAGLLALSGCGADEPAAAPAPSGAPIGGTVAVAESIDEAAAPEVWNVAIHPRSPKPGGTAEVRFEASDTAGGFQAEIRWMINGAVASEGNQRTFDLRRLGKNDELSVEVLLTNGRTVSNSGRDRVRLGNLAPVVQGIFVSPTNPKSGDELLASPNGYDSDGDDIEYRYEWEVNGQAKNVRGDRFDTTGLKRGDRIVVRSQASDGEAESPWAVSELELVNSPPEIKPVTSVGVEDGMFRHQLEARDADGDRGIRFSLREGPSGLRVDAVTGVLTWRPSAADAGVHSVEVAATDRLGDSSAFRFELRVAADAPPASTP